jgi:acetyltransferase-like isoleucine patch superfamily enzyme
MSKVVLYGTGRGADVARRFLQRDSDHQVCGFTLDSDYMTSDTFCGLPVVAFENVEKVFPPDEFKMLTLLGYQGMNGLRRRKYEEGKAKGYGFISYVNSHFYKAGDVEIGENCFILDNQSISLDVRIGNNVVLWSSNHIGDLTVVEDHVWLASHVTVAAEAVLGAGSFLGLGATVGNRVKIAPETFVGAQTFLSAGTTPGGVHLHSGEVSGMSSRQFMRIAMARGML